jgi:hypothetical protein
MTANLIKRDEAYMMLDESKLGWYHFRFILTAGFALMAVGYELFCMTQGLPMM